MAGNRKDLVSVELNSIELFEEAALSWVGNGKKWVLDNLFEVDQNSVFIDIEQLVMVDIENGAVNRIHHILLAPRVFNILYMEGKISYLQMMDAVEDMVNMTVKIKGVKFAGYEFEVWTMPSALLDGRFGKFRMATIDQYGEIV